MGTTLEIDEDVVAFARSQAQREHMTVGEVISRLAREGIPSPNTARLQSNVPKTKFVLLPARNEIITTQHVCDLMDQQGI